MRQLLFVLAFAGVCALVQPTTAGEKKAIDPKQPAKTLSDAEFLQMAATGSNIEMQTSKLVDGRTDVAAFKDFAKKMLDDHKKMGDDLSKVASELKIGVAAGFDAKTKDALAKLRDLKGTEFEREYAAMMVKDHQETLDLFKAHMASTKNDTLKNVLKDAIPLVEEHLKMAKALPVSK